MRDTKIVYKTWGKEYWIENNDLYCGKVLICHEGKWSSGNRYHHHRIKDETFYIEQGSLLLVVEQNGNAVDIILDEGDSYRIAPGTKHKFMSPSGTCKFFEFSTKHSDDDSYYE